MALGSIIAVGRRLASTADALADRTGMGEAAAGALLLGAVTSLPGIGTTVVGALGGDAQFALANPLGGERVADVGHAGDGPRLLGCGGAGSLGVDLTVEDHDAVLRAHLHRSTGHGRIVEQRRCHP
ncbi:hypothetical protein Ari01nite_86500 [Paractinoplanes rishiriensis]|uniref:Sodium/calcium exchanger membrane region domain-containing protein n=1 Tax=Paractinoplanes rishiriensis TaxID=1050105 RepID=A0A919K998_9ACTN|nr:hypothetical protein Ari01nite_86500 [Actinoplanes rishiriensis]